MMTNSTELIFEGEFTFPPFRSFNRRLEVTGYVLMLAISPIGMVLNVIVGVITKEMVKKTRTSGLIYIQYLSVVNAIGLFFKGIFETSLHILPFKLQQYHPLLRMVWVCKTQFYAFVTSALASSHLTFALSIDRLIAIASPIFYKFNMSVTVANVVSSIIMFESIASGVPGAIIYTISTRGCPDHDPSAPELLRFINFLITSFSTYLLPLISVSIVTSITVFKVKCSQKKVKGASSKLTKPLLTVCIVFSLSMLVSLVFFTLVLIGDDDYEYLLRQGTYFPLIINESSNFFLLYWTSQDFKQFFWKLFQKKPQKQPKSRTGTISQSSQKESDRGKHAPKHTVTS